MIPTLTRAAVLLGTALALSACVVAAPGPGPRGCLWVPPHYGEAGVYHPGHCR